MESRACCIWLIFECQTAVSFTGGACSWEAGDEDSDRPVGDVGFRRPPRADRLVVTDAGDIRALKGVVVGSVAPR